MLEHEEPCNVCRTSEDLEILFLDSVIEVVILTAPAIEAVRKAVDLLKLLLLFEKLLEFQRELLKLCLCNL